MFKTGLEGLYLTGAHKIAKPVLGGVGAIFMLHRVVKPNPRRFHPNGILEISPEFLDQVLARLVQAGFDLVDMDEAQRRLRTGDSPRPYAAFTLDDGYRDNRDVAYPVFAKYNCPHTVYIPTTYIEGRGELWWLALEEVIAQQDKIDAHLGDQAVSFDTRTLSGKQAAYNRIYWWLRTADEDVARAFVRDLAARYHLDMGALCRDLIMNWDELRAFSKYPLLTLGAHTMDHYALAKQSESDARRQMQEGADVMERLLGQRPQHFAYPYGSPCAAGAREFRLAQELGFKTAVTTRPGLLYAEHSAHMTALPRVSLNGHYQSIRYLDVLLSGLPFYMFNGLKRLNVA